ncbi:MAG: carotenoid oxygenase family protein [Burkholderiaceae bacterium]
MMNRREAMVRLAAVTAGSLVGLPRSHALTNVAGKPGMAESGVAAFASSFEGVRETYPPVTVRFSHPLPSGLSGTLYRNGPALMSRGEQRYQHWFDGDGMVQSFRLSGQTMTHQAKLVQTDRLAAESAAGRYLWPGFGTAFKNTRHVRSGDDMNVANISVLPVQDELLALWEGGSAWRLDPETLKTKGRKVFSTETDGLSFSAHPRQDPDGRIWNFGYLAGSGKLVLYDLAKTGQLNRAKLIDAPNADMVHDFAVTERFLVFVLTPLQYQRSKGPEARSFLQRLQWQPEKPVIAMIVSKETLAPVAQFELPPFFVFHFGNAYEDGQSIRLDVARAPDFDELMSAITQATLGQAIPSMRREQSMQLVLDLENKTSRSELLPIFTADFPRFDQRFTGQRASRLFMLSEDERRPQDAFGFGQLIAWDHSSQRLQRFSYEPHVIAEEHIFVAAPGKSEGVGWILGTSFDVNQRRTSLSVFDSRAVDAGPISTARLPYHLPLGLHGQFVAA